MAEPVADIQRLHGCAGRIHIFSPRCMCGWLTFAQVGIPVNRIEIRFQKKLYIRMAFAWNLTQNAPILLTSRAEHEPTATSSGEILRPSGPDRRHLGHPAAFHQTGRARNHAGEPDRGALRADQRHYFSDHALAAQNAFAAPSLGALSALLHGRMRRGREQCGPVHRPAVFHCGQCHPDRLHHTGGHGPVGRAFSA